MLYIFDISYFELLGMQYDLGSMIDPRKYNSHQVKRRENVVRFLSLNIEYPTPVFLQHF